MVAPRAPKHVAGGFRGEERRRVAVAVIWNRASGSHGTIESHRPAQAPPSVATSSSGVGPPALRLLGMVGQEQEVAGGGRGQGIERSP